MDFSGSLFSVIGNFVKVTCDLVVSVTLTSEFAWLQTAIVAIVALMITYKGYQTLMGQSTQPIKELTWDIAKKLFIMMFVLNTNGWLTQTNEVCNAFYEWAGGGNDLYTKLDTIVSKYIESMTELFVAIKSLEGAFQFVILGLANTIALALICFSLAFTIFISQLTNSLLVFILPVALCCLMWPQTKQIFAQWLSLFISNLITILVYSKLGGQFLDNIAAQMSVSKTGSQCFTLGLMIIGMAFIVVLIVKLATSLAQGMASASLDAAGAGVAAGMAGATGAGIGFVGSKALGATKMSGKGAKLLSKGGWNLAKKMLSKGSKTTEKSGD